MRVAVEVRPAVPADLAELADVCALAREESSAGVQLCAPEPGKIAEQLGVLLSVPGGHALVARVDGRVAGFVLARTLGSNDFLPKTVLYLEGLYVRTEVRRRGVGHALLAATAELATDQGATDVYAVPIPGSRGVQRFLARVGFAPAATHRYVSTNVLQRRLASEAHGQRHRGRAGSLEELIARRRRSRGGAPTGSVDLGAVRGRLEDGASTQRLVG
ncbi:GNAT family N-acetyltransferase [Luteimicrobium sp. DT211]|uniref:GNAT family N-acetyltransferase n=1 Tax=Luteimicrobium sp. DT211 TaxID=3393412 RepID=UPI003CE96C24